MLKIFFALVLSLVVPFAGADEHDPELLKKAPVVLSGIESLHEYKKSFELEGASLEKELIGFNSKTADDGASSLVYNIPLTSTVAAPKLQNSNYNCLYTRDDAGDVQTARCSFLENNNERAYTAAEGAFTVEDFQDAAISFVKVFEEAFGDPAQLSEVKFWRSYLNNEANIQVKYQWAASAGPKYMYCHLHAHNGGDLEMGCHRQRDLADPFQPNRLARAERFQP